MITVTLEQADEVLQGELQATVWDISTDSNRTKALNLACKRLNALDIDESYHEEDGVIEAAALLAEALLAGADIDKQIAEDDIRESTIGVVKVKKRNSSLPLHLSVGIPTTRIWNLLFPYLGQQTYVTLARAG